jgi:5-methyltetrahydrofolate--homocysteine methyltransferase
MERKERIEALRLAMGRRVIVLDGAMGTMIQKHGLEEEDYRGARFADWEHPVKGNNELLSITRPDIIREIHLEYFRAGSDMVETNTFGATVIAQSDYKMEALVDEMNLASAKVAREAAEEMMREEPGRVCWVAGALGPTPKTASLSPDVNDPGFRAISFDQLADAYLQQARQLWLGGVDVLLVETIFDTLNAKAALYAIQVLRDETGEDIPIMVSGTITDASGRTLSGQTVEAFLNSVSHAGLLSIGLNCALGASDMLPYIEELSEKAPMFVTAYPNAGLPNAFGQYDQEPETMAGLMHPFMERKLVNLVGGCCGSTPDHIRAIADMAKRAQVREVPQLDIEQ